VKEYCSNKKSPSLQKIKRGCVKTLAQPFYMHKAQTFTSPGFVITQSSCMFRHKVFRYGKLHFRPYIPNQAVLFPRRIDEILTANDSVRIVNTVVDNLILDNFKNLYKATGRCLYHPKMMLKVIIHAYMNNIYSCRKKEGRLF